MSEISVRTRLYRVRVVALGLVAAACFFTGAALHVLDTKVGGFLGLSFEKPAPAPKPPSEQEVAEAAFRGSAQELLNSLGGVDFFNPASFAMLAKMQASLENATPAMASVIRTQITNLLNFRERLLKIPDRAPVVAKELSDLVSQGRPLNPAALREQSAFRPLALAAEALIVDFVAIQKKTPLTNVKGFQTRLNSFAEAYVAISKPEFVKKLSPADRLLFKRIESLTLTRSVVDWESAVFSAIAATEELRRLASEASVPPAIPVAAPVEAPVQFDRGVVSQLLGLTAALCFLAAAFMVFRFDQDLLKRLESASDVQQGLPSTGPVAQVVESLPYMQMASKQISELSANVLSSLKRVNKSVAQMPLSAGVLMSDTPEPDNQGHSQLAAEVGPVFSDLRKAFSTLREQSIRLFLAVSSSSSDPRILELLDRVSENLEYVETLSDRIDAVLLKVAQPAEASLADSQALEVDRLTQARDSLQREIDGLLVQVAQWARQSDRLGGEIAELAGVVSRVQNADRLTLSGPSEPRLG